MQNLEKVWEEKCSDNESENENEVSPKERRVEENVKYFRRENVDLIADKLLKYYNEYNEGIEEIKKRSGTQQKKLRSRLAYLLTFGRKNFSLRSIRTVKRKTY